MNTPQKCNECVRVEENNVHNLAEIGKVSAYCSL
jgi:hypothetical protein